jgi:hypothetical protein
VAQMHASCIAFHHARNCVKPLVTEQ